jgi:PAS domain S-box-containing protein
MTELFRLLTPITYWLLIVMWSFILFFYIKNINKTKTTHLVFVLLLILSIDAFRTLFESVYFGFWYTSLAGMIPRNIADFLMLPEMVIIPKLINVFAAILVIFLLLKKWLPEELKEKQSVRDVLEKGLKDEATIAKQKYFLEKAQELGQIGTWELDLINNKLYWTDENCRIFGVPPGTIATYDIFIDKIHPDDREYVNTEWMAGVAGKPYDIEHRLLIDDEITWVREKADVTFNQKGDAVSAIGFTQDITERKQNENEIRENDIQSRKLFEDSFDAILLIDETGVFVECNQAALDLLKMTREQFLFLPPENISPDYQPNGFKSDEAAIEMIELAYTNGGNRFDWTCINSEGKEFIVEVSLMPIMVKGQNMLHTTWRDITKRKQAENRLKNNESLLSSIAENYPNSFVSIIKNDFTIGYSAGQAFKKQNLDPKQFSGLTLEQVFGENAAIIRAHYQKTFAGEEQLFELFINSQHQLYKSIPLFSDDGNISRILVVVEDITDRKQAELERQALESQLRQSQKLEAVGTMVGGVAHEFNNSLQSLFLYADMVKEQLPEDKNIREDFDGLLGTANDAKRLVEQVMLVSSQDSGDKQLVNLPEVITEVINFKIPSELSNIKVELDLAEDCPQVFADREQIHRAIENILDNGILALEEGGVLGINLKCETSVNQPGKVLLTISDSGVGMTEDTLNQIFNPFFTTREIGQGKGFGLSIVYNILQNMGGSITATSVLGEGSSFLIEFPIEEPKD